MTGALNIFFFKDRAEIINLNKYSFKRGQRFVYFVIKMKRRILLMFVCFCSILKLERNILEVLC